MEKWGHECVEEKGDDKMKSGRKSERGGGGGGGREGDSDGGGGERENIMNSDNAVKRGVKAAGTETD